MARGKGGGRKGGRGVGSPDRGCTAVAPSSSGAEKGKEGVFKQNWKPFLLLLPFFPLLPSPSIHGGSTDEAPFSFTPELLLRAVPPVPRTEHEGGATEGGGSAVSFPFLSATQGGKWSFEPGSVPRSSPPSFFLVLSSAKKEAEGER